MALFTGFIASVIFILHDRLWQAFSHNHLLNATISIIAFFGVCFVFYQFYNLYRAQEWLEQDINMYQAKHTKALPSHKNKPAMLLPLITFFEGNSPATLTPLTARSLLTSIETRIDQSRDVPRYLMGLLIFLGLLGTFWGLSQTISSITAVINDLSIVSQDPGQAITQIKQGLRSPLGGMGTAFSCSLFGLSASLAIGFLDLQVSRVSDAFVGKIEEELTSLIACRSDKENHRDSHGTGYISSLLEQNVEQTNQLIRILKGQEDVRGVYYKQLSTLIEKLNLMSDQIIHTQSVNRKTLQIHEELRETLDQFHRVVSANSLGIDQDVKNSLRSMEALLQQLIASHEVGRNQTLKELRGEIRLVAKTISTLGSPYDAKAISIKS